MADIEEIIEYMKSLKKGFDKCLFQNKIEELAHQVDTVGLNYEDFHILFKLWLNLSIPITKWTSVGLCLVPQEVIQERTVDYALRWILANCSHQTSYSRIVFVLDWLTAAMDGKAIDMKALDNGYEIFYVLFTYDVLTPHAVKLVYALTKPVDVTRRRVLELIELGKKSENKKNIYRQFQIVLGLFKSYKPECVPENIPAVSINTSFKKVYTTLVTRFKRNEDYRRNSLTRDKQHLLWANPFYTGSNKNKLEQLVPDMKFCKIGSSKYNGEEQQKNYFDFTEPVSLVQYLVVHGARRPARLRALLGAAPGLALLALARDEEHEFLSHDLHHTLTNCFLDGSRHSLAEKQLLLQRLAALQRTMLQGIPVLTRFLAQYLPVCNEKDYFYEILQLVEWLDVECPNHVVCIVEHLNKIYHRAHPIEQCAIMTSLTNLYTNLVYASTRERQYFMSLKTSQVNYLYVLPKITLLINDMCSKGLQVNPCDMRLAVWTTVWCKRAAKCASIAVNNSSSHAANRSASFTSTSPASSVPPAPPAPPRLCAAAALLLPSALLMNNFADILITYQKILQKSYRNRKDQAYVDIQTLMKKYTYDMVACLHGEDAISLRHSGLVYNSLSEQLIEKIGKSSGGVEASFGVRNHFAFAPYTYVHFAAEDHVPNEWFDLVIGQQFTKLSRFMKQTS